MKRTNKFVAALSIAAISTLISSVAFAADGDMYEKANLKEIKYTSNNLAESTKLQRKVTLNAEEYGYEYNGKIYTFDEVNKTYAANKSDVSATLEALDKSGKEIGTVQGEKVEVKEVKSVAQTIAANKDQEISFEVNGANYTYKTFVENFGKEGYTVKFYTNKDGLNITDGKVNTNIPEFKYSVEVKDKDGKAIPTDASNAKNFAEVTVKSDAVEKVTEAKLNNNLDYVTMNATNVEFMATKGVNGLGKEMLPGEGTTSLEGVNFLRAVSSDTTIAYVENNKIVPIKEGKVTFDVYFNNVKEPVKVNVEVKAAQVATSMEVIKDMKVATGEIALAPVKVLDQYGKEMKATPVVKVTDKDNKEVAIKDNKVQLNEAGKYTVKIFDSSDKDAKQLGIYQIETVKVDEKTTPEVYEFEFNKEDDKVQDTLDIEKNNNITIDVIGKKDGVKLELSKFHKGLDAKSDNESVKAEYKDGKIFVSFEAGKIANVGEVKITLQNKEGEMVQDLASTTVKVVNTAPQIGELKLSVKDAKAITAEVEDAVKLKAADIQEFFNAKNVKDQLTAGKDKEDKEILTEKMIKEVKFIERHIEGEKEDKLTGKVHVTLDAKYGGKTFVFNAEVTITEKTAE
ncbi:hypothetical protein [Clostridium ihumii]|uniref:hypothetical protein n=1 Tax=Clostridium ihumii TaxID=1470356 RepID=UPI003D3256C4